MEAILSDWLVNQAPIVVVLVIGFAVQWRQNAEQQKYLCQLLDKCWNELTDCVDEDPDNR